MPTIVGLGEVLWDLFPDRRRPGGAPANVAYHAQVLGNRGVVASRVGEDELGRTLTRVLDENNVDTSCLQVDPERPTGTVEVTITDGEPSYTITPAVAWDNLAFDDRLARLADEADAVCFSTLAQRAEGSRATIRRFLDAVPASTLRVLDVNLRPPHYSEAVIRASIARAEVVKVNRDEWTILEELFDADDLAAWLIDTQGIELVCLTKGADGSALFTADAHADQAPPDVDASAGDAVGVGDAFLAVICHHGLRGTSVEDTLAAANRYASYVVTQRGGMPAVPPEILREVV